MRDTEQGALNGSVVSLPDIAKALPQFLLVLILDSCCASDMALALAVMNYVLRLPES